MNINAAIFILTQNTIQRKVYLKTSLYFLFRNFNSKYNYPVIILHEGDFDALSQNEIVLSIRKNHRHLVIFKEIDKSDFELPENIDKELLEKTINTRPVPYWRNMRYRLMCNFWMNHFIKYTEGYDYVMRLDDDSIIEEPINTDLFSIMKDKDLAYLSNIVHVDCGICNFGMKNMFENILPEKLEKLNGGLFLKSKLSTSLSAYSKFKDLQTLLNKPCIGDVDMDMPIMYYNNFFVTSTLFWKRDDVKNVIDKINANGGIFYYRYGDAPLQTIIVTLLEPTKISRSVFKYSKRLQREVFIDDDNDMHSYMPHSYEESSCIIKKNV